MVRQNRSRSNFALVSYSLAMGVCLACGISRAVGDDAVSPDRGVCVVLGLPTADVASSVQQLAEGNQRLIYFQAADSSLTAALREAAESARLLGRRVFVEQGPLQSIHLADNVADQVLVFGDAADQVPEAELLRVLHPGATAIVKETTITKPASSGVDSWSHPYHRGDNNPQSTDQIARAPYRTQFLAGPLFSPMPEITVAANGRIYKAFGHIAHKANQNEVLNSLMCINAYNGTVLWQRDLKPGFMIHRNTMVATPDSLYMADDKSCKIIDGQTGEVRDEIVVPDGIADGSVWKWMAMQDGVLYALIGGREITVDTVPSSTPGLGHWPWGMWKGHEYSDPRTSFGFGRTLVAFDTASKELVWMHRETEYLDSRGVCMGNNRIYFYSPEEFLGCIGTEDGTLLWKNTDSDLLQAIGPNGAAQHYVTGYATTTYIKCNDDQLFFAGPQRSRFVVASTEDGHLLWQKRQGNLQIVLRDDGVYAAGPQQGNDGAGAKYSYDGQRLASLPVRRACTRATGSIDSIFYRTSGGTVRVNTASNHAEHIAPMRPPCQDGVIISDGLLFWGPWMCGCQLSLYGHISLGPAASASDSDRPLEPQLQQGEGNVNAITLTDVPPEDWPAYQHDSWRSSYTSVGIPDSIRQLWTYQLPVDELPSAPVMAGGITYFGDWAGVVRALDPSGEPLWSVRTGGPIYFPPTVADGRLFAGSADGRVYALEAATGRFLWSYRVAPEARWIPVYGKLISTWPVAGGVAVQDGVVYAAAGIAHYDGTHVVALDAATGEPLWQNNSSGALAEEVNCGISLQGELQIRGNELQFLGGGAYLFARYDRSTGTCLNEPRAQVTSQFQTAFYPYFPMYGKYSSLHHTFPDGRTLTYSSSYDGSRPTELGMLEPAAPGSQRAAKQPNARRTDAPARPPERNKLWQTDRAELFSAFVLTTNRLIAGGPALGDQQQGRLSAIALEDGKHVWDEALPTLPVKAGIAMDHQQRIVVALENGQIICFGPGE